MIKYIERIGWWLFLVACFLLMLAVLFGSYGMVLRYFFDLPQDWVHEISSFMLLGIVALSLAYILRQGGHISVTLLVDHTAPAVRHVLRLISSIMFFLYCIGITWAGFSKLLIYFRLGSRSLEADTPMSLWGGALFLGLLLLTLQSLVEIGKAFIGTIGQGTKHPSSTSDQERAVQNR